MRIRELGPVLLLAIPCLASTAAQSPGTITGGSETGEPQQHTVNAAELASWGTVQLTGDWVINGDLSLGGDARLTFRKAHVRLYGNLSLNEKAELAIEDSSVFNLAQTRSFQYAIEAKGHSILRIEHSEFQTNGGETDVVLPTGFVASDDASLVVDNAYLDMKRNWFLGGFKDRSKLISKDTVHLPNEIYPQDASTLLIEGKTEGLVWLKFLKDEFAIIDDMPGRDKPATWSFGRDRPEKTNVHYQIDWRTAVVQVNVQSTQGSNITIKNNIAPIAIGYRVDGGIPETVSGFKNGTARTNLTITRARQLTVINSIVAGWQFDADHTKMPAILKDSTINEAIAGEGGTIHADRCRFEFGGLGVFGDHGRFDVTDSDIRSFSVFTNKDGVMTIKDSIIHGSTIQATDTSRLILLNDNITTNTNPYFGGTNAPAHFVTHDKGLILGLGIASMNPVKQGTAVTFTGDAFVESQQGITGEFTLTYRKNGKTHSATVVRDKNMIMHSGLLGRVQGSSLKPGSYTAQLSAVISDGTHLEVERHFEILK